MSEHPYFFGLLPSDAECYRLTRGSSPGESTHLDEITQSDIRDLRWKCLSLAYFRPGADAVAQRSSDIWGWITEWFPHIPLPYKPFEEEPYVPEPTPQNIDELLSRLKKIDAGMVDLMRLVTNALFLSQ